MASDGYNRSRCMAYRITAARAANDRLRMLQFEQRVVGDMGSLCRRLCIDCLAGLSFLDEPSRVQ